MPNGTRGPGAACFAVTCDPVLWLCTTQDGSRHGGKEFAPAAETELEAKTEAKAEAEAEEVPVSGWNHKGPRAVCFWDHDDKFKPSNCTRYPHVYRRRWWRGRRALLWLARLAMLGPRRYASCLRSKPPGETPDRRAM